MQFVYFGPQFAEESDGWMSDLCDATGVPRTWVDIKQLLSQGHAVQIRSASLLEISAAAADLAIFKASRQLPYLH